MLRYFHNIKNCDAMLFSESRDMRLDYAAQPVKYESMAAPIIGGSILCEPDEIREALDACA